MRRRRPRPRPGTRRAACHVVEVVDASDRVLAAAGQHERVVERVRRLGRDCDPLGRDLDVVDAVRRRVVVLDGEPRGAGLGEERHRLGDASRIIRVAALAVDVERERGRLHEETDVRDELLAGDLLVELAERPRVASARRRERLEAGGREQPCRAHVPWVRHDEDLLPGVQLAEAGAALGYRHRRSDVSSAAGRSGCTASAPPTRRRSPSPRRSRPSRR